MFLTMAVHTQTLAHTHAHRKEFQTTIVFLYIDAVYANPPFQTHINSSSCGLLRVDVCAVADLSQVSRFFLSTNSK